VEVKRNMSGCALILLASTVAVPAHAGGTSHVFSRSTSGRVVLGSTLSLSSIRADYWGVLSAFAGERAPQAVEGLARLESRALADRQPELLAVAELQVAERLAEVSPESLVALIRLHEQTLPVYLANGDSTLLDHAVAAERGLAALYVRRSSSPQARATAADLMAGLFVDLASRGAYTEGQPLFEAAISCDRTAPAVHVIVGARDELEGRYADAVEHFRQAVELEPDDLATRLRLAVNLRRVGRDGEAVPHLERCLAPAAPEWIRIVAAQERARVAMDSADWAGAIRVLEGVKSNAAQTPGLDALLAYAHDRLGESRKAGQIAELVMTETEGVAPSARLSYARWPEADERLPSADARVGASPRSSAALSEALRTMQAPPAKQ
jgi:tetratricopeptide (TPR) repeat protein